MSDGFNASQDVFDDSFSEYNICSEEASPDLEDVGWRGVSLNSLRTYGPLFPKVQPSSSHSVLFRLPFVAGVTPAPYPQKREDIWDYNHVRLPNSPKSVYAKSENDFKPKWPFIKYALNRNVSSSQELEEVIFSYNAKPSTRWSFDSLHTFFSKTLDEAESEYFFETVLPSIVQLALSIDELITTGIPVLKKHVSKSISLTQRQISCLLANAFLCTFPQRNSTNPTYPSINFNRLFQNGDLKRVQEKLKCIINYFRRVCFGSCLDGVVTFTRRYVAPRDLPNWSESSKMLPRFHIATSGSIEDEGLGMMEVDFANKFVGGGVLGRGSVQEEIKFMMCPELILSRLFTECLDDTEALIITGSERFNNYCGYADSFKWAGDCADSSPRDVYGRRCSTVVAIDAYRYTKSIDQYKPEQMIRELNKAFSGFSFGTAEKWDINIATGNWGCGAFKGNPKLKALIQLMAAAEANKDLAYFTFSNTELTKAIYDMYTFIKNNNVTVGKLWNALQKYYDYIVIDDSSDLYEYLYKILGVKTESRESEPEGETQMDLSNCTDDDMADVPKESLSHKEPLAAETYSMKTEEGRKRCIETEKQRWLAYEHAKKQLIPNESSVPPKPVIKRKISDYFVKKS